MDTLAQCLCDRLAQAEATDIDHHGNVVTFRAGMFRFVSTLNPLIMFSSGVFVLTQSDEELYVSWRLSLLHFLTVTLILVVVFTQFAVPGKLDMSSAKQVVGIWAFLVSGNLAIGALVFAGWLDNVFRDFLTEMSDQQAKLAARSQ